MYHTASAYVWHNLWMRHVQWPQNKAQRNLAFRFQKCSPSDEKKAHDLSGAWRHALLKFCAEKFIEFSTHTHKYQVTGVTIATGLSSGLETLASQLYGAAQVCVCVCVCVRAHMCVCARACMCVCACVLCEKGV